MPSGPATDFQAIPEKSRLLLQTLNSNYASNPAPLLTIYPELCILYPLSYPISESDAEAFSPLVLD